MVPDDLITPKAAAKLVNVHISSVYRWVLSGKLKGYRRAGSRYLVSRADVLGMIQPVEVEAPDRPRTRREEEEAARRAVEELRRQGIRC